MCRISNIIYRHPQKKNICNNLEGCVGEVLLKQWKQGNTSFSKTRKRPLEIGVFFLQFYYFYLLSYIVPCGPYKYQKCGGGCGGG